MEHWSEAERRAELRDATEALAAIEGALILVRAELAAQCARTVGVYGERGNWPASSEFCVREIEDRLVNLRERRVASLAYAQELKATL